MVKCIHILCSIQLIIKKLKLSFGIFLNIQLNNRDQLVTLIQEKFMHWHRLHVIYLNLQWVCDCLRNFRLQALHKQ